MGGQACVFYGAAQFSKGVDFLILADEINFAGLHRALAELSAGRNSRPGGSRFHALTPPFWRGGMPFIFAAGPRGLRDSALM